MPVDYALAESWLARPAAPEREAATFFLYPTCYFGDGVHAEIDDPGMRQQAEQILAAHGGVFDATDLHAPYYRQLGLSHLLGLYSDPAAVEAEVRRVPLVDAIAAFECFLEHDLGDRPLLLASHSQGSIVMQGLLLWIRRQHPGLLDRLVAAYVVGVPLGRPLLDAVGIPFAEGATDTGVAVAWSSEAPGAPANPFVSDPPGLVINPISWTRDETPASAEQSLGGFVRFEFDRPAVEAPHFADARLDLDRGTVVTHAEIAAQPPWPQGVLHRWDYDLYWHDLRQNVRDRVAAYLG